MAGWTHAKVYCALICRGEKVKRSPRDRYVQLYRQRVNCALLYPPTGCIFSDAPLHMNSKGTHRRKCWDEDLCRQIKPFIQCAGSDSKSEPDQTFSHFRIIDWNGFAKALGLKTGNKLIRAERAS